MQLSLFSSTPDMEDLEYVVKVLTGSPKELAERAVAWGYDGIEFMPNPEDVPNPVPVEAALKAAGALLLVVNTGRMYPQGMALLHPNSEVRQRSIQAFKRMLDFAGYFQARVGLGIARGDGAHGLSRGETDGIADDVFRDLSEYAGHVGATIMLEPADPGSTNYINTVEEAMAWVDRVGSPSFTVMLDTYELATSETSIEHGIRAARRQATHIHLYDPSRWPPGVLPEVARLDWERIAQFLHEEQFRGSGSVVLPPEGDPEPGARKAAAYLRNLFGERSSSTPVPLSSEGGARL